MTTCAYSYRSGHWGFNVELMNLSSQYVISPGEYVNLKLISNESFPHKLICYKESSQNKSISTSIDVSHQI